MSAGLQKGWTRPETFVAPAVRISPEQLALFPRKAAIELPRRNGADIYMSVEADNGVQYHLKLDRAERWTRASEWLCYRLAQLVGVPVPRCEPIRTFDNDVAFGSENIGSVFRQIETYRLLNAFSLNEVGQCTTGIQLPLSVIHTFDMFVNNVDRHLGNFVSIEKDGFLELLAIDFSRAFFWRWPFDGFMSANEPTREVWVGLRERHGFDRDAALSLTNRLASVTAAQVDGILGPRLITTM